MAISNLELRQQIFGKTNKGKATEKPAQAVAAARKLLPQPRIARPALQWPSGMAAVAERTKARLREAIASFTSAEPDTGIDRTALAARLSARALAATQPEPARLVFADVGKGIAVALAIFLAITNVGGRNSFGIGWIDALAQFLHSFAVPAFLVFAGMFLRNSREDGWLTYVSRKIAPLAAGLTLWLAAVALMSKAHMLPGAQGPAASWFAGFKFLHHGPLLLVLPLFFLMWRALSRFRTGTVFVLAAIAEILHTEYGGIVWIEATRGFAYFAAGHVFADKFRALARFARENPSPSLAIAGVWAAFNGLLVYADMPLAAGDRVSTLPFASLALGLSGAAALTIIAQVISAGRFGALFSEIGRHWIGFYAIVPLVFLGSGEVLDALGLFATAQDAIAALFVACIAAGAALAAFELREDNPQTQATLRKL